ncbi:MAG: LysE family translocator [Pseudomonadota bacterium]
MSELLTYLPGFATAYAILLVAVTSPGPAVAMLLGLSLSNGRGTALVACAGIASGGVLLNLGTMLGLGLLLSQIGWAMMVIKYLGAAYLAWLAYGAFRRSISPPAVKADQEPKMSRVRAFVLGFLLQITNIKAIAFWLVIAAVGATTGGGAQVILAFAIGAFAISFLGHGAWAILLSSRVFQIAYAKARRWIEAVLGGLFALLALRMAMDRS